MQDQYEEDFLKFTGYITGDAKRREALEAAMGGDDGDAGGKKGKKGKKKGKKKWNSFEIIIISVYMESIQFNYNKL